MGIAISLLALLATLYQLYLQRRHNEKSLKPLGQIDLLDQGQRLAVYLRNNGLGPLLVDRLVFTRNNQTFSRIEECLDLNPRSYMHVPVDAAARRVVLPNSQLVVFEQNLAQHAEGEMDRVRQQLAGIRIKVEGRDIYDNRITLERDFSWFARYLEKENA